MGEKNFDPFLLFPLWSFGISSIGIPYRIVLKCFEGFADNVEDAFVYKINHQFRLRCFFFPKRSKVDYLASVPHHRYYWRKKGFWKNPKGHETHGEITMSKCCRGPQKWNVISSVRTSVITHEWWDLLQMARVLWEN